MIFANAFHFIHFMAKKTQKTELGTHVSLFLLNVGLHLQGLRIHSHTKNAKGEKKTFTKNRANFLTKVNRKISHAN